MQACIIHVHNNMRDIQCDSRPLLICGSTLNLASKHLQEGRKDSERRVVLLHGRKDMPKHSRQIKFRSPPGELISESLQSYLLPDPDALASASLVVSSVGAEAVGRAVVRSVGSSSKR